MTSRDPASEALITRHNTAAPWWAAALLILCLTGLATTWVDFPENPSLQDFWKGYVLDMAGPAWTYILIRGLFTAWRDNAWTRYFSPVRTMLLCLGSLFAIETVQYMQWYDGTYDPWDLVAYVSLVLPAFGLDLASHRVPPGGSA